MEWMWISRAGFSHPKARPVSRSTVFSDPRIHSAVGEKRFAIAREYRMNQGVWIFPIRRDAISGHSKARGVCPETIVTHLLERVFTGDVEADIKIRREGGDDVRVGVLCPDATDRETCLRVAQQIRCALKPFTFSTIPDFREHDILMQRKEFPCKLEMDLSIAKAMGSNVPVPPLFDTTLLNQCFITEHFDASH